MFYNCTPHFPEAALYYTYYYIYIRLFYYLLLHNYTPLFWRERGRKREYCPTLYLLSLSYFLFYLFYQGALPCTTFTLILFVFHKFTPPYPLMSALCLQHHSHICFFIVSLFSVIYIFRYLQVYYSTPPSPEISALYITLNIIIMLPFSSYTSPSYWIRCMRFSSLTPPSPKLTALSLTPVIIIPTVHSFQSSPYSEKKD